jgi:hypothetical protein
MANVKHGNLTASPQWWKHLKDWKRVFWKSERQAHEGAIKAETHDALRRRGMDRTPYVNDAGDTTWPDSETGPHTLRQRRGRYHNP